MTEVVFLVSQVPGQHFHRIEAVELDGRRFEMPADTDIKMNVGPGPSEVQLSILARKVSTRSIYDRTWWAKVKGFVVWAKRWW
jgi:hypothetical protein